MVDRRQIGLEWISHMDSSVSRQHELLKKLLELVASDKMYRWLLVCCSLARSAGDEFSDVDIEAGIDDELWPTSIEKVKKDLRRLGQVYDSLDHILPDELGRERHHLIVMYKNNLQLSFLVSPSSNVKGLRPDGIALFDLDNKLSRPWDPAAKSTTPAQAREWAFLAWLDLIDAKKYLDRGSLWEALDRLNKSRNHVWQLWAIACNLDFAIYGITQLLDDRALLPPNIEMTSATLDLESIKAACIALFDVLEAVVGAANKQIPFDVPIGMAETARKTYSLEK